MSDGQMAELYERLVKGKKKKPGLDQIFLRGWNAGIDFALKQMRLSCDEQAEEETMEAVE